VKSPGLLGNLIECDNMLILIVRGLGDRNRLAGCNHVSTITT
jgi:hypothetical protein